MCVGLLKCCSEWGKMLGWLGLGMGRGALGEWKEERKKRSRLRVYFFPDIPSLCDKGDRKTYVLAFFFMFLTYCVCMHVAPFLFPSPTHSSLPPSRPPSLLPTLPPSGPACHAPTRPRPI